MKLKSKLRCFLTISEDTSITGYLNVAGNVKLSKTLTITTPSQGGGNIIIIPMDNVSVSSIGYYTRSDARATEPGDVWICGVNSWSQTIWGFSMGSPGFGSCLNISSIGSVSAPYKLLTPTLQTNNILSFGNNEIT